TTITAIKDACLYHTDLQKYAWCKMKKKLFFMTFISCVVLEMVVYPQSFGLVSAQEESLVFNWAFGAMIGDIENRQLISIPTSTVLKTGDQFKALIIPQKDCFVYLISHGPQDEITLLFPYEINQFDKDFHTETEYYIPQGNGWYEFDTNTGKETFYLLAATYRLVGLEKLLKKYSEAKHSQKKLLVSSILSEIKRVKKNHKTLTASAERPITIGGTVRGINKRDVKNYPNIAVIATQIAATEFFSRTFRIDHQ
ncbi:MAG: DUF4384 domain-containing protein, partial [Deltaproteobacteria bacterium]|nr:DUF4384 domain-containing protein [Deltaproteobacteria bacterium]